MRVRCRSVPHLRLEWTEAEHELRQVFSSVRYSRFGGPFRGGVAHSGMLAMMLSIVLYDEMLRGENGLGPVLGLSPVISSHDY